MSVKALDARLALDILFNGLPPLQFQRLQL